MPGHGVRPLVAESCCKELMQKVMENWVGGALLERSVLVTGC